MGSEIKVLPQNKHLGSSMILMNLQDCVRETRLILWNLQTSFLPTSREDLISWSWEAPARWRSATESDTRYEPEVKLKLRASQRFCFSCDLHTSFICGAGGEDLVPSCPEETTERNYDLIWHCNQWKLLSSTREKNRQALLQTPGQGGWVREKPNRHVCFLMGNIALYKRKPFITLKLIW